MYPLPCQCSFNILEPKHIIVVYLSLLVSYVGLQKCDGRQQTDHNCVCIHGYLQPQPFIEKVFPQLKESDDGFIDRLLICFPKTHVLLEEV